MDCWPQLKYDRVCSADRTPDDRRNADRMGHRRILNAQQISLQFVACRSSVSCNSRSVPEVSESNNSRWKSPPASLCSATGRYRPSPLLLFVHQTLRQVDTVENFCYEYFSGA